MACSAMQHQSTFGCHKGPAADTADVLPLPHSGDLRSSGSGATNDTDAYEEEAQGEDCLQQDADVPQQAPQPSEHDSAAPEGLDVLFHIKRCTTSRGRPFGYWRPVV
jgi:hypothetical protein